MRLALLTLVLMLMAAPAQAAAWIEGVWKGSYQCAQGETRLTLTIHTDYQGNFMAGFQFWKGEVYGSFRMRGVFTETGELKFNPTIWITRPEGYEMVGLAGQAYNLSGEGKPDVLAGDVTAAGCGRFSVERQPRQVPGGAGTGPGEPPSAPRH